MNPVKQVLDLNEEYLDLNNKVFEPYIMTDEKLYEKYKNKK